MPLYNTIEASDLAALKHKPGDAVRWFDTFDQIERKGVIQEVHLSLRVIGSYWVHYEILSDGHFYSVSPSDIRS